MSSSDNGICPDQFYSPREVARLDSCCAATVYVRMAKGQYQVFKDGRKTVIPGSSILERRRKILRPASFKLPQRAQEEANTV
jgi:hypothetical protein